MFEDFKLFGTPEKRIVVQTKLGTNLDAIIGPEASERCRKNFELLRITRGANWIEVRKPATGGYNCAGMVWATRRAHLPSPDDWRRVLQEDGYRRIESSEAKVGDVVVYFRNCDQEPSHVGRVCTLERIYTGSTELGTPFPRVLSKWDVTSGECIHAVDDVHLDGGEPVTPYFYTDR